MADRVFSAWEQMQASDGPLEGGGGIHVDSEAPPAVSEAPESGVVTDPWKSEAFSQEPELSESVPKLDREAGKLQDGSQPQRVLGGWRGVMAGLFLGVMATLAGIYGISRNSRPVAEAEVAAPSGPSKATAQSVTVAPVEVATVLRTLDATGTVTAQDLLPVLPQANGLQIKQVVVKEGDMVEKGQVMAVLDDSVLRSQMAEAIAKVQSADAATQQAEVQVMQAHSGQQEAAAGIDQAQARVVQAKADALQAASGIEQAKAGVAQAEAGIAQTRAKLEQAQREVFRYQDLASQGVVSQQELEKRKTEVTTAQADVNKAVEELNKSIEAVRGAQAKLINAQADIKTAEAAVNSAKAKLDTSVTGIYSAKANVGNNQANVRSNVARAQQLKTQLEQTVVRAPESGIVADKVARIGDITNGSQKLFTIIRGGKLELQVKVPETQLSQIRVGAPTKVTSDADSRIAIQGKVREFLPTIDPQNRQATVKIDLPAIQELREFILLPGMFMRVAIATSIAPGLKIPAKALLPQADGKAIVYRLTGADKVQAQSVEVGEVSGGSGKDLSSAKVEVKSGLNPGDRVVVAGAGYLKDGDRVRVISENGVMPNSRLSLEEGEMGKK